MREIAFRLGNHRCLSCGNISISWWVFWVGRRIWMEWWFLPEKSLCSFYNLCKPYNLGKICDRLGRFLDAVAIFFCRICINMLMVRSRGHIVWEIWGLSGSWWQYIYFKAEKYWQNYEKTPAYGKPHSGAPDCGRNLYLANWIAAAKLNAGMRLRQLLKKRGSQPLDVY
jgi:hypothetical protein